MERTNAQHPRAAELEQLLDHAEERATEYVAKLDLYVRPDPKTNAFTGFRNPERLGELSHATGCLRISAGTPVAKRNVPKKTWEAWVRDRKLVPRVELVVAGTRAAVRDAALLVYDRNQELTVSALRDQGGFNSKTNHNAGVENGGTIGDQTQEATT